MIPLSLEERLLRMLWQEEEGEARSAKDLRALPVEDRVLEGECIASAVFRGVVGSEKFEFAAEENSSKFRTGDSVIVGDGIDFEEAVSMAFGDYDGEHHIVTLKRDPYARDQLEFEEGRGYCVDRRPLGLRGRLQDVVREGFADDLIAEVLEGRHQPTRDDDRYERALLRFEDTGLNDVQLQAGASAIATNSLALIQGPPGTGKTRLLAEVLRALCRSGCRIALSAFTHRAVDNALLALRELDSDIRLFKLGAKRDPSLIRADIRGANPRRGGFPAEGCVVAGTSFALAKLPATERFHFAVFDESGQLPIPHAMAGMLCARRWIFVGDHKQLPPVITTHHVDRDSTASIFEHLNRHYGSSMLNVSYRMNGPLCDIVGEAFYGSKLCSAVPERRMPFSVGGTHDDLLGPEKTVVLARVDHLQPGMRSTQEANLIADLVYELLHRHGIAASQVAVLAPFRAQVRAVRSALQKKGVSGQGGVVVDTVERMQGQEREVVFISLAVGDPDTLSSRAGFFFSTNRLNVAMSRARSKVVLVASRGAFMGLPMDPESLRAASLFKELYQKLPQVDLTKVYG